MYWYRYYGFFRYINSLWEHSISVPRLIWLSDGTNVKNLENMFRYGNWRVHGIIETLGKSGANPENEEYDTHPP